MSLSLLSLNAHTIIHSAPRATKESPAVPAHSLCLAVKAGIDEQIAGLNDREDSGWYYQNAPNCAWVGMGDGRIALCSSECVPAYLPSFLMTDSLIL